MIVDARITYKASIGNPNGSGESQATLPAIGGATFSASLALVEAFLAVLVTNLLDGDYSAIEIIAQRPAFPGNPADSVNVDNVCKIDWAMATEEKSHVLTVQGIDNATTYVTEESQGDRLNAAGKALVAAALTDVYGSTNVTRGIFLKRK